jgi:ferredoxin-type protein NapF
VGIACVTTVTAATTAISRKQFLRGDFAGRRAPRRPPWAIEEAHFIEACTRCTRCIAACPQSVLAPASGGFPAVDFARGECTFCGECARVCGTGALHLPPDTGAPAVPWHLKAELTTRCLAAHGVICRTCGEVCETGAISFRPRAGGVPRPELRAERCTGCGACYAPCPVLGIEIR